MIQQYRHTFGANNQNLFIMKKLMLFAVLAVGFSITSAAQDFHFGAKGGVNFASLSGDDVDDLDGRTGFHIGAVAQIGISEKFAIQPELIYSSQGADFSDLDANIDYLNLPILADIGLTENISIQAGPQFGFKVGEGDDLSGEDLESLDLSGAVGVQATFSKFFAQARYNLGFSDIADNADAKNSVFQISVGYWFL